MFIYRYYVIFSILCLFTPFSISAQLENWDNYIAMYDKGPGSTMVDMALKDKAPVKEFPFALITGVTFSQCNKDGFPNKEQFPELYIISDSIKQIVLKNTKSILAGTFTYQCERIDYYYIKDTSSLRHDLTELYGKVFPKYKPYINIKLDKDWEGYLSFLYPNEATYEYMMNQKVLFKLEEAGDDFQKPRKVEHWLYFTNEADCTCFSNYAKLQNFTIEKKEKITDKEYSYRLLLSRKDKIDISTISAITLDLRRNAKKCNGNYDGWETIVTK